MMGKQIRVQAIIIRNGKALFAFGNVGNNEFRHSFIGGRLEPGESTEAGVLRELYEEACIKGTIVFQIPDEIHSDHITYLVDIGDQDPILGENPEERNIPKKQRHLQGVMWIDLEEKELFTEVDKDFFKLLLAECKIRNHHTEWLICVEELVSAE